LIKFRVNLAKIERICCIIYLSCILTPFQNLVTNIKTYQMLQLFMHISHDIFKAICRIKSHVRLKVCPTDKPENKLKN
jgi:hypothetical protein